MPEVTRGTLATSDVCVRNIAQKIATLVLFSRTRARARRHTHTHTHTHLFQKTLLAP